MGRLSCVACCHKTRPKALGLFFGRAVERHVLQLRQSGDHGSIVVAFTSAQTDAGRLGFLARGGITAQKYARQWLGKSLAMTGRQPLTRANTRWSAVWLALAASPNVLASCRTQVPCVGVEESHQNTVNYSRPIVGNNKIRVA